MTIEEYALKILSDHGCDRYTYGGEFSKYVLDDLKKGYPNGMEYPYIDVANAILSISRPTPIAKDKYKMVYDTDSDCDSVGFETFEQAQDDAFDTLHLWMQEEMLSWEAEEPTDKQKESWDYMIYNCGVWVEKYNENTDEYEKCWSPTQKELDAIGWTPYYD